MKFRRSALALAVSGLLLAGCGSEDAKPEAKDADSQPTMAQARAAMYDYLARGMEGDAGACQYETSAYTEKLNESMGIADCAARFEAFKEFMADAPAVDVRAATIELTENKDGSLDAAVTHKVKEFGGNFRMIHQGGKWLVDADLDDTTDALGDSGPRQVSEADAIALETSFCQVKPGVTRDDVVVWMGTPDEETIDDDGQTELSWAVNQDNYSVWLEADKVATYSSSTPREAVVCPE